MYVCVTVCVCSIWYDVDRRINLIENYLCKRHNIDDLIKSLMNSNVYVSLFVLRTRVKLSSGFYIFLVGIDISSQWI